MAVSANFKRLLANFILFQTAWFVLVLAPFGWDVAGGGLLLLLHLRYIATAGEWRFLFVVTVIGGAADSALAAAGLIAFNPDASLWTTAITPLWLLLLWAHFAATINHSLSWLRAHPALAFVGGGIAGPLAYIGGDKITDKLDIIVDLTSYATIAAPLWALLCLTLPRFTKPAS